MRSDTDDRSIALFIDFENLSTRTGLAAEQFDIAPALDTLLDKGKVLFRRAYCDWSRFTPATRNLHEHGVELIDVPPSTRSGKNGADVRLVIDAFELAYLREHIDTFVIASGDSDFCPLAYKLREIGRTVIGLGVREATSPLFVKACDEFIYLKPARQRGREGAAGAPREKEKPAKPAAVPELARPAPRRGCAPGRAASASSARSSASTIRTCWRDAGARIGSRRSSPPTAPRWTPRAPGTPARPSSSA